ncbi:hypothetical protein [Cryobacterium gelidum]|uniref:Polysaccharide chain length determinant N-terminal domain-containing protein n=1 Tax=Cryobacterium gelidum TaxID=1259164 RepID=A0A4R9ANM9_9MICO|nr:hypothetical protein [Cryobacterium gelidum]TFD66680.1 hypothetical protein E3T50_15950 [Cryobacterium gelidum]
MSQPADGSALGLEYYGIVLRRQWRVIVGGVVLGALAAGAFLVIIPSTATATTDVTINIISTDPFNASKQASGLLDGTTETQIATSYSVAKDAAEQMGSGVSATEVRRNVEIAAVTGASIVHIAFTSPTASGAHMGADAIADAYLAYRTAQAQSKLNAILQGIEARRTALGADLADANSRISSSAPRSAGANQATSDSALITIELNTLLTQKGVLSQIDTAGGSILTTASQNDITMNPDMTQTLGAGLLAGGVLGLIAAFAINPRDQRLRNALEVSRATNFPVLADIRSKSASIPESRGTLELLRTARERILTDLPINTQVIAIFDDTGGRFPSDIPINLAVVLAQSGLTTHLILPRSSGVFSTTLHTNLDLIEPSPDESGVTYRSRISHNLDATFPTASGRASDLDLDLDLEVSKFIRKRVDELRTEELYFLVVDRAAPRSSVLAALRLSEAAIVVVGLRHSKVDGVADIVTESARLGTAFLGTITVPQERSLPAPNGSTAPDMHDRKSSDADSRAVSSPAQK